MKCYEYTEARFICFDFAVAISHRGLSNRSDKRPAGAAGFRNPPPRQPSRKLTLTSCRELFQRKSGSANAPVSDGLCMTFDRSGRAIEGTSCRLSKCISGCRSRRSQQRSQSERRLSGIDSLKTPGDLTLTLRRAESKPTAYKVQSSDSEQ